MARKSFKPELLNSRPDADDIVAAGYGDVLAIQKQFDGRIRISEDGAMRIGRITLTPTGLPPDTEMDETEFENIGGILARLEQSIQWLLGDWLAYGETKWGESAAHIAEAVGLDVTTLHTYTWVCRKIEFSNRLENLTFTHHIKVAAMPPKEQRHWLHLAAQNNWSVAALVQAIKASQSPSLPEPEPVWARSLQSFARHLTPGSLKKMTPHHRHQLREHLQTLLAQLNNFEDD